MHLNSRSPFVLGAAYFTEQYEIKNDSKIKVPFTTTISHFELKLADITNEHPDIPFIILGDFNSKIGLLNQIDEECIPVDATAFGQRFAVDDRKDSKGEKLLEVMEKNGKIALNGRFPRDSPAQYTYFKLGDSEISKVYRSCNGSPDMSHSSIPSDVSTISDCTDQHANLKTSNPCSIIDLAFCSLEHIEFVGSFEVLYIPTSSDHMPISVTLKINVDLPDEHQRVMVENEVPLEQYSRIMWNEQQKDAFVQRMDSCLPPEDAGDLNIDDLSSILQSTITQSAKDAGFTTKKIECQK